MQKCTICRRDFDNNSERSYELLHYETGHKEEICLACTQRIFNPYVFHTYVPIYLSGTVQYTTFDSEENLVKYIKDNYYKEGFTIYHDRDNILLVNENSHQLVGFATVTGDLPDYNNIKQNY